MSRRTPQLYRGSPRAELGPWSPADFKPAPRERDAGLESVVTALWRHKGLVLLSTALVMITALALTLVWPETYESSATLLVERAAQERDIPALAALERVGRGSTLETEKALIESRRVIEPVVEDLQLHVDVTVEGEASAVAVLPVLDVEREASPASYDVSFVAGRGYVVRDAPSGDTLRTVPPGEPVEIDGLQVAFPKDPPSGAIGIEVTAFPLAVSSTIDRISVQSVSQEGELLRLSCSGSSPAEARDLCDGVTRSYVRFRTELQRSDAAATAAFLRDQVARLGDSLAAAEESLEEFRTLTQSVALQEQASEEVRNYAALKAQRDQIAAQRQALDRVLGRIERNESGGRRYRELAGFPTLLGNQTVTDLMASLTDLENRRRELALRRTEENPELQSIDRRIETLERQLGTIARSYEESMSEQVSELDQAIGGSQGRLSSFPERQVRAARLEREVQSLSELYDELEARLREAEVAQAVEQPGVSVLDTASLPLWPSSPRLPLNLALAMVLGLTFGAAAAVWRDHGDSRIHDRDELGRRTELPVLSMIPTLRRPGPVLPVELARNGNGVGGVARLESGEGDVPSRSGRGIARVEPDTRDPTGRQIALEAFRSLGADIQFLARREGTDLRSIAVTSPGRGEGKTFTSSNLAITRAALGVHTLLVDADMRAGGVARFFDLDPDGPGLSEMLAGEASAREARREMRVDRTDPLAIMPAGAPTADAAELLQTSYFEAMLAGAQAVYDLVVIDTPPLNLITDAAAVVAAADAVLVVVRRGVTDGETLELTLERLERTGSPVLGIVLNDVELPKQFAYGGYPYGSP